MFVKSVSIVRASFRLLLLSATVGLLALVALSHVLPSVDRDLFIVRGGSMSPSIPLGSAVIVRHVTADSVALGDVITFHGADDSVITHRVTALPSAGMDAFQTKGDASSAADPFVVPGNAIIGRVESIVPVAGSLLIMLGTTIGVIATLALLGGLAVAVWFMDEVLATVKRSAKRRAPVCRAA